MDISQAPDEITIGELYKEIAKKKKVANTKEKLPRGKELKPFKEIGKEKVGSRKKKLPLKSSTPGELSHGKDPEPFKELGTEKVGSRKKRLPRGKAVNPFKETAKKERKKKLPIKSTSPEELCAFYTPEELCDKYTPTELREKFGLPKLAEMLPRHRIALMVFPRPVY